MVPNLIDQFRIDGKVAVITGASRGIGEGIAIGLADQLRVVRYAEI